MHIDSAEKRPYYVLIETNNAPEGKTMKRLQQTLCTKTDSFSYTVIGEEKPLYHVDSSGVLRERGEAIGKFCLGGNRWHLRIGEAIVDSGPENGLFYLPEFELQALTAVINNA